MVKDLSQMAGPEKHKSNVNRWKYKHFVSLNFFLENISFFLFLRGRRYRVGRDREEKRWGQLGSMFRRLLPST